MVRIEILLSLLLHAKLYYMPLHLHKVKAWLYVLGGLFLLTLFLAPQAQATHLRAGNIFIKSDTTAAKNPLRFFFKLVTYSVAPPPFEDLEATLYFGDCTQQTSPRASRVLLQNGQNNTFVNTYFFEHIYSGGGTFTATFVGENRNGGVVNISNSVQQTFFLQSTLTIDRLFPIINRSPVLEVPPVDVAVRGQIFVHNPGAYDPDGDSLSFKLLPSRVDAGRDACGNPIGQTAPGYRSLDQFLGAAQPGGPAGFSIDRNTGQITWNTPNTLGEFNFAFIVEEWRNGRLIGTVIRDMQVFVRDDPNRPPVLIVPRDTCVVAGTLLRDIIKVRDPDKDPVTVTAFGSMLPPATFRPQSDTSHIFTWQTTCLDVRRSPYQVVFRAEDRPPAGRIILTDLKPWRISVVGPPPVLVSAVPQTSSSIRLNWSAYTCPNATRMYIYRREGPSNFKPGPCETGIPASAGYVRVGEVSAGVTTFLDNNGGKGLERNKTYCYRIYAEFPEPGGGSSIASNELCATLESISLTKVSVLETSATTGKIRVEWNKPKAIVTTLTPPLQYRLLRTMGQGRSPQGNYTQVFISNNLNDTVFTDNNLNTLDTAYAYRVEFYHSGTTGSPTVLVDSSSASSVRLNAVANGATMVLNWTYNVPWNNASTPAKPLYHVIYLKLPNSAVFQKYDSVLAGPTAGTFSKQVPLEQGKEYCAYVVTKGTFQNPLLPDPILNNSQITCFSRPCVPILTVDNDCDDDFVAGVTPIQNRLSWTLPTGCNASDIDFYKVYFRETDAEEFKVIATIKDLAYLHQNLPSFAGCYYVTATDKNGSESERSNIECEDNCIVFVLPNIFTPNNDGSNDEFTPKQGATFIKKATLKVYNRWGNKVYESSAEPGLRWKGVGDNGKALAEGTYFYQVEVEFYGRVPEIRTYKGWVEILR